MTDRGVSDWVVGKVDKFIDAYGEEVVGLLGARELSDLSAADKRTAYSLAREAAFKSVDIFDFLSRAYEARILQLKGSGSEMPKAGTDSQKIGAYLQSRLARWSQDRGTDRAGTSDRGGFSGKYQRLADMVNLIPPDNVLAPLCGVGESCVSSARHYAKTDGYEFERVSAKEYGRDGQGNSWYEVVARPEPEPDPEPEDPRLAKLRVVFPDKSDEQLSMLLAFA